VDRQQLQNRIEIFYREIRDITLVLKMRYHNLDNSRAEILHILENILRLKDHSSDYKEGMSQLDDSGLVIYANMLEEMLYKMKYGGGDKNNVQSIQDYQVLNVQATGSDTTQQNTRLTLSASGEEFIKSYELLKIRIYDARNPNGHEYKKGAKGEWTIGYGHKLTPGDLDSGSFENGITIEQANVLFRQDVQWFIDGVHVNVNNVRKLLQNQFDALVSVSYNSGRSRFAQSELRKTVESYGDNISSPLLINSDDFKKEIANGFRDLIPLDNNISKGIKERRFNEYQIFIFGEYNRDPTPSNLEPLWNIDTIP